MGHSQGPSNVHKVSQMIPVGLLQDSCPSQSVTNMPSRPALLKASQESQLASACIVKASAAVNWHLQPPCAVQPVASTSIQQSWETPYPEILGCVRLHHSPKISFQGLHDALQGRARSRIVDFLLLHNISLHSMQVSNARDRLTHPMLASPEHKGLGI